MQSNFAEKTEGWIKPDIHKIMSAKVQSASWGKRLFPSGLLRLYLVLGSLVQERHWQHSVQAHQVGHGPEHMVYEERLWELDQVKLKKGRFMGDLIAVYNELTRRCGENKARFFLEMDSHSTRGNRCKTQQGKFQLGITGKKLQWG